MSEVFIPSTFRFQFVKSRKITKPLQNRKIRISLCCHQPHEQTTDSNNCQITVLWGMRASRNQG